MLSFVHMYFVQAAETIVELHNTVVIETGFTEEGIPFTVYVVAEELDEARNQVSSSRTLQVRFGPFSTESAARNFNPPTSLNYNNRDQWGIQWIGTLPWRGHRHIWIHPFFLEATYSGTVWSRL